MDDDALVEAFLAAGLSAKTITLYLTSIRRAARWFEARGADLATAPASLLAAYAETLPASRSSRALLRSSLSALWRAQGRPEPPLRAIRVPKGPRMVCRALDELSAHALATVARARGDRAGAAVLLGLYAGLRRAEIARLAWREIDRAGWVTIAGKGDLTRSIPLHPVALEAVRGLGEGRSLPGAPQRSEWVFPSPYGGPVHPTTVWTWAQQVGRQAGLELATHVLRHTCLATALDATCDLRAVQELAGHARPETTAGYTRVHRRRLEAAVAAIDFEAAAS